MDVLIRKVKKTPGSPKPDSGGAVRHEKLGEGWAENKQPVAEDSGVVFYLKYLGFTLVDEVDDDESYGDGASTKAVQRIVGMAKSEGKKLKKVALTVKSKGLHMVDITTKEVMADLSIYRISFCTADRNHDKVFAFIARSTINETMECHAFLCAKTKIAQAVTLTVWQAFNVAQDKWTDQQQRKSQRTKDRCKSQTAVVSAPQNNSSPLIDLQPIQHQQHQHQQHQHQLQQSGNIGNPCPFQDSFADFNMSSLQTGNGVHTNNTQEPSMEDSDDDLEDSFSKLAETRGRVRVPSFGTDLRQEDVDDGVHQYMDGRRCFEEFSRQRSIEDLLSL